MKKEQSSEYEIVKSILSGKKEEYKAIIEKYQDRVFHLCFGYVHNEDDANDLAQEAFINAYQNLDKFRFDSQFSTWLFRIAVNLSLNYIRSKRLRLFDRLDNILDSFSTIRSNVFSNFTDPEKILIEEEHRSIVHSAVDKLPEKQKSAFILSRYNDLSQKEIAHIMNISEGAVESLLQRAKANLEKELSKYFKKK